MSTAYLTIDDGPTRNTKQILDYLLERNIVPIMFFWGERVEEARENAIYAIQKGAYIGNHTFSHPHFSEISLAQCLEEIERQEEVINGLYQEAGVKREVKLFRFPYGDKGGEKKEALQLYLASHHFCKLDYSPITFDWYYDQKHDQDYDTFWTFDYEEYRLHYDKTFSYPMIKEHIDNPSPANGGSLHTPGAHNIILIHDHTLSDELIPGYFYDIIDRTLEAGVTFVKPKFLCN